MSTPRTTGWIAASAVALGLAVLALPGCVDSPDCGICDKDRVTLTSISGPNYAGELVHLVSPTCDGPNCPAAFDEAKYFTDEIGPCIETDAAKDDPFGAAEYCKIAPIVVADGLQFIFNNLLEPTERIRKRPDNPNLFETYEWKTRVLSLRGPGTRYAGDWREDPATGVRTVSRLVNLTCIENLTPGTPYDPALCTGATLEGTPLKMRADQTFIAPRGRWDDRALGEANEIDCEDPQEGIDECCSQCDFALTGQVAKYGVVGAPPSDSLAMDELPQGVLARPDAGAIACDPRGDRVVECGAFQPWTSRRDETLGYDYDWDGDGARETWRVSQADRLRETHPANRPAHLASPGAHCGSTAECRDADHHGLPGTECIGTNDAGQACAVDAGDPACGAGRCVAEWFVACRADPGTTGAQGYCVDVRHDASAAPGCVTALSACTSTGCTATPEGERVSACDGDGDGVLTAAECCGEGQPCDPTYAANTSPPILYDRKATLPARVRSCSCEDDDEDICVDYGDEDDPEHNVIEQTCAEHPSGAAEDRHDYAINFVTKLGGIIDDNAVKGVKWLPADLGGVPRAAIEACAEERGLIAGRNIDDGWRAHDADALAVENYEDFDRAMCSGQTYTVEFAVGDDDEVLRDQVGNTLAGKSTYTFETPQFHVVPGSGFPSEALKIGPCDVFTLQLSNKYDLSPENLRKLEIRLLGSTTAIAGGPDCVETLAEVDAEHPPCLLVDAGGHHEGRIGVRIDPIAFGQVLQPEATYEVFVPGFASEPEWDEDDAEQLGAAKLAAEYSTYFWDACGMPLVHLEGYRAIPGNATSELLIPPVYTFTIDPASCRDDADGDGIVRSCDNADDVPNPTQTDLDADGFGDAADPCPTLASAGPETGDTDRDGIGNACDACSRTPDTYNRDAAENAVRPFMYVRNIPAQTDVDEDGIGDVCDNCPTVANCGAYGPDTPYRLGDARIEDEALCQTDLDDDMIGDACADLESAAGPVGFGDTDDFDQDGLINADDACPRQPVPDPTSCVDDTACGEGRVCETTGVCDHVDDDADGVGDACDTCPYQPNAGQLLDGAAQEDDEDGDFIGSECELGAECQTEHGPRPLAFYDVAVDGQCCTTALVQDGSALVVVATGEPLVDPDGLPVRLDCDEAAGGCRQLPLTVAMLPGVLELPGGCAEALTAAGYTDPSENPALQPSDTNGDLDALWSRACTLPPADQDFDGVGDACDLCVFGFDPSNAPYVDETGKTWAHDGAVCNGSYAGSCVGESDEPEDDDGGADGSGTDGGDSTG